MNGSTIGGPPRRAKGSWLLVAAVRFNVTICTLAFLFAALNSRSHADSIRRPNIVLIYADDVGFGDVGCYGATTIPTPRLDQLANAGLRFTSGYSTSATCTPSRYSLLTGDYAWRRPDTGIAPPNCPALIKPGVPTLASTLRDAGYRTGIIGKWHLGLGKSPKPDWSGVIAPGPIEVGFDESFIMPTTNDRVPCVYVRGHRIENLDPHDPVDVFIDNPDGQVTGVTGRSQLRLDWSHRHNDSIVNGISRIGFMTGGSTARWRDESMGDVFVDEARRFLQRNSEKPFFLFYSAHEIHVPRAPNERFAGRTPHGRRGDAMVEFDWCVGELLDELAKLHLAERTLVIVTSDNGPVLDDGYQDEAVQLCGDHRPAGPFRGGKYSRYEGGTRVPWIVSWPGHISPGTTDALISQVDLPRTLANLAGAKVDPDQFADSLDMSAALLGRSLTGRTWCITHSGLTPALALRSGRWKYIEPADAPPLNTETNTELANTTTPLLFDLQADPGETVNVAGANAACVADLKKQLLEIKGRK